MQVSGIGLHDFENMFDLKPQEQSKKILECGEQFNFDKEFQQKNSNVVFYHGADLKQLPFENDQFDIALCAFKMFNEHHAENIYLAITEMARVAFEVRIYPLCDDKGVLNPLLGVVMAQLQAANLRVEIRAVNYEAFKGSNAMLRVWREECAL